MHQRVPGVGVDLSKQQALDHAAAGIAVTDQACGDDARVVDDEQIARREERRQIGDVMVPPLTRRPVDDQQPRRAALGRRCLRDELGREVEREIREAHDPGS